MKKVYLFLLGGVFFASKIHSQALSVSATAVLPTVCASNSTAITANANPVNYGLTTISHNPIPSPGPGATTYLADAGVEVTPRSFGVNLDDCRWDNITLPFTFNFYGVDYTSVNISSNGWVAMGPTNSTASGVGVNLASGGAPNSAIHLCTSDLDLRTASGGTLEYFEDGSFPNRVFVILYTNVKFNGGSGLVTVEAILKEGSNEVEIHTSTCTNTQLSRLKAQGVENSAGTVAAIATGRNNTQTWTGMPNAFKFTPEQFTYSWSPAATLSSGTGRIVTATPAVTTTYTVTTTRLSDNATANGNITITVDPASYTLANTPTPGGATIFQFISVATGGTYYRDGNCNLISRIVPSGAFPVDNSINVSVRLDTGATKKGTVDLYGARTYDMEPIVNASTATATVTLYYLQSEFNKFNLRAPDSAHKLLPTGSADAAGIANLIIRQFHGTGTMPGNYSEGTYTDITTATPGCTVTWNSTRNWWEVQIPVNGFSGFYLTSQKSAPVPIKLEYFKGSHSGNSNVLDWKVNCTSTEAKFAIERSPDARSFGSIGNIVATQLRCAQPFDFTDAHPLGGINYYRLKMIDVDGKAAYSNIVALVNKENGFDLVNMQPNLVRDGRATLSVTASQQTIVQLVITDIAGKVVQKRTETLNNGSSNISIDVNNLASGTYQVTGYTSSGKSKTIRFVKQ